MVVHLQDTRPADAAMVATIWLVLMTPFTVPLCTITLCLCDTSESVAFSLSSVPEELPLFRVWNFTRISDNAADVTNVKHRRKDQEDDQLVHTASGHGVVSQRHLSIELQHWNTMPEDVDEV